MSIHTSAPAVPRFMTIGVLALISASIALAAFSSQTGIGRVEDTSGTAVSRMLTFIPNDKQQLEIRDGTSGELLRTLPNLEEGFIIGALRGLQFNRNRVDKPLEAPYRLMYRADQGLALIDPSTGVYVQLEAFGKDNVATFAAFLPLRRTSRSDKRSLEIKPKQQTTRGETRDEKTRRTS
ncbi:MAG: photosynthetic complex assembly protein PuhC [Burkholderiaceae bacterium]